MMPVFSRRTILLLLLKRRQERRKKKRKTWVRKIFKERKEKGEFHQLIYDLCLHDSQYFFQYFRMNSIKYENLLLCDI